MAGILPIRRKTQHNQSTVDYFKVTLANELLYQLRNIHDKKKFLTTYRIPSNDENI